MFSLPFFNEGPGDEATSAHAANDSVYCWFSIYTAFDHTKYSGTHRYSHVIASTNGVDFLITAVVLYGDNGSYQNVFEVTFSIHFYVNE